MFDTPAQLTVRRSFTRFPLISNPSKVQDIFIRCLRLHGLWPDLGLDGTHDIESAANAHSPPYTKAGFLSGNVGLVAGILLEAFQTPTPRRAVALGRDPAYLEQRSVTAWDVAQREGMQGGSSFC